jgi:hypothetical protein
MVDVREGNMQNSNRKGKNVGEGQEEDGMEEKGEEGWQVEGNNGDDEWSEDEGWHDVEDDGVYDKYVGM